MFENIWKTMANIENLIYKRFFVFLHRWRNTIASSLNIDERIYNLWLSSAWEGPTICSSTSRSLYWLFLSRDRLGVISSACGSTPACSWAPSSSILLNWFFYLSCCCFHRYCCFFCNCCCCCRSSTTILLSWSQRPCRSLASRLLFFYCCRALGSRLLSSCCCCCWSPACILWSPAAILLFFLLSWWFICSICSCSWSFSFTSKSMIAIRPKTRPKTATRGIGQRWLGILLWCRISGCRWIYRCISLCYRTTGGCGCGAFWFRCSGLGARFSITLFLFNPFSKFCFEFWIWI